MFGTTSLARKLLTDARQSTLPPISKHTRNILFVIIRKNQVKDNDNVGLNYYTVHITLSTSYFTTLPLIW